MAIQHKTADGEIRDGDIRYVLMRPDVLMGVGRHLGGQGGDDFFAALEASAFQHAQASFSAYRQSARFGREDFLASTCLVAGELGWGRWRLFKEADRARIVQVDNSPFAVGHGPSSRPVCSPISGVLRAAAAVGYGEDVRVEEFQCAAQGAAHCCFRLTSPLNPAATTR